MLEHDTGTRAQILEARGYDQAVIAGNGHRANDHQPEAEELPAAAELDRAEAVGPPAPAPACALPGCDERLPPGPRRKYHSAACADQAEARRLEDRRSKAKAQREAKKGAAAPAGRPLEELGAGREGGTAPAGDQVDEHRSPVGQLAGELLAAGYTVEVRIDGATLVARR